MRNKGARSDEGAGEASDRALLEGLRQFIAARYLLSPHRSKRSARGAGAPAGPQAFSREVIRKNGRLSVTDTLEFLHTLFGLGRTPDELPGFSGGLVHRELGATLQQSFYTWFVETALSLSVRNLEQRFERWPNQPHAGGTLSGGAPALTPGRSLREADAGDAPAPHTHVIYLPSERAEHFPVRTRQRDLLWMRAQLMQTLRAFEGSMKAGPNRAELIRALSTNVYAPTHGAGAGLGSGVPAFSVLTAASRVFAAPQQHFTGGGAASTPPGGVSGGADREPVAAPLSTRGMAEKIKEVYFAGLLGGAARPDGPARPDGSARLDGAAPASRYAPTGGRLKGAVVWAIPRSPGMTPDAATQPLASAQYVLTNRTVAGESARPGAGGAGDFFRRTVARSRVVDRFEWVGAARPSSATDAAQGMRPSGPGMSLTGGVLLRALKGGGRPGVTEDASAPPWNRAPAAMTVWTATAGAHVPAAVGRAEGAAAGLTFLRREELMRTPPQSYAFARTARPATVVEERVVGHAREKEVEEIVRKEVATVMKSRSPFDGLSRADYSRIADHVYSSLARRLMAEKERSGLRR